MEWRGSAENRWFRWLALANVAGGAILGYLVGPTAGVALVLVGAVLVLFERVEVQIGEDGLRARAPYLGWPRVHFPLDEIEAVTAIEVRPRDWGGWGYRGSVRLLKRAAWLLRKGAGIQLDLRRGRTFLVTVDDASTGAAVLAARLTPPG